MGVIKNRETVPIVEDSTRELIWFTSKHTLTVPLLVEYLTSLNFMIQDNQAR
tara:strand:- start:593 stop:748 length:156 start_codon:yes stop_codon:yes gene_type:complete